MQIAMYDLTGQDDRRFSGNCWRTRMALAHKGIRHETRPVSFAEIPLIGHGEVKTVPALDIEGGLIVDSWKIAQFLEEHFPEAPSLFGGEGGLRGAQFFEAWMGTSVIPALFTLIVADIFEILVPHDQRYFRETREKRLGKTLEAAQAGREDRVQSFRQSLQPVRNVLSQQDFLGGETPLYLDYLMFGHLQFARVTSSFAILTPDDPLVAWFDRCLDLYDGLGRSVPARSDTLKLNLK